MCILILYEKSGVAKNYVPRRCYGILLLSLQTFKRLLIKNYSSLVHEMKKTGANQKLIMVLLTDIRVEKNKGNCITSYIAQKFLYFLKQKVFSTIKLPVLFT